MRKTVTRLGAGAVLAACVAVAVLAATGDLDATFGTGGQVIEWSGTDSAGIGSLDEDAQGRLVAVVEDGIVRYLATGARDTSFGVGGHAALEFEPRDVTVLADGMILVSGTVPGPYSDIALARLDASGSLDATFGATSGGGKGKGGKGNGGGSSGGVVIVDYKKNSRDYGSGMVVLADLSIVVACTVMDGSSAGRDRMGVVKFTEDGVLDTSFGDDGFATFDLSDDDGAWQVVVDASGRLIVGGNFWGTSRWVVLRITAAGDLDATFGTGGVVTEPYSSASAYELGSHCLAVQPDGKILVGGRYAVYGLGVDGVVIRYLADGSRDTSFGTGGVASTNTGRTGYTPSLALLASGKIAFVAMETTGIAGDPQQLRLYRFDASGALELTGAKTSFAARDAFIDAQGCRVIDVLVHSSGRIVAGGPIWAQWWGIAPQENGRVLVRWE